MSLLHRPEEDLKVLARITGLIAVRLVEMFQFSTKKNSHHHDLILSACQLFARCYYEAAQFSQTQENLGSTDEFGHACNLMHAIKKWLSNYLPKKLTADGKSLVLQEEFQVIYHCTLGSSRSLKVSQIIVKLR